jgi:type II secretory pathway pseudopilin PulG
MTRTSGSERHASERKSYRAASSARHGESGWALLTILLFCAVFIITLATVLPIAAFETHRQREQDLMDHGKDYMRAIQLYYRKFRRYPARLEDLENTNQIRFLRKRWKDPMTGSEEWRLIHMNAAGVVVDSVLTAPATANGQPGSTGQTGVAGLTPSLSMLTPLGGTAAGTSSGFSGQPTVVGAGIAGVASKSDKASIMVYNTRQKYNEWEFIYDPRKDPLMMAGTAAQPGQTGQPGQAGQPGTPGQPGIGTAGGFGAGGSGFGSAGGFAGNPPGSTVGVPVTAPTTIPHP